MHVRSPDNGKGLKLNFGLKEMLYYIKSLIISLDTSDAKKSNEKYRCIGKVNKQRRCNESSDCTCMTCI